MQRKLALLSITYLTLKSEKGFSQFYAIKCFRNNKYLRNHDLRLMSNVTELEIGATKLLLDA